MFKIEPNDERIATQPKMPNERDDGNTTTITAITKKVGDKEGIILNEKIRTIPCVNGEIKRLLTVLFNNVANKFKCSSLFTI